MRNREFQEKYILKKQDYGILFPYIIDEDITDINWNGRQLWINDFKKGKYPVREYLTQDFVEKFSLLLSNICNLIFNKDHPIMEVETSELKINIVHSSVAPQGTTITLKKLPAIRRLEKNLMIENKYCSEDVCDFLIECIKSHLSIIVCGLPGAGKTELVKFLTKYIPPYERVITIEDILEFHLPKLAPKLDSVEYKVAENFSYGDAFKEGLRQLPSWMILSEAHSEEVNFFLESVKRGIHGITTLITDNVRKIPEKIMEIAGETEEYENIEKDIYSNIDIGVMVKAYQDQKGKIYRRLEQICLFYKDNMDENRMFLLVENGRFVQKTIPQEIKNQLLYSGMDSLSDMKSA